MISKLRARLSYANVMATIAVFLAFAGVAGASGVLGKTASARRRSRTAR